MVAGGTVVLAVGYWLAFECLTFGFRPSVFIRAHPWLNLKMLDSPAAPI
jgi:hypothetical protein